METKPHNAKASIKSPAISWFRRRVLSWYKRNGRQFPWRKKSANRYQKIIAEVLLQRTQASMVANFIRSFVKRFPSWEKLASANGADLEKILKPLGIWRSRVTTLERLSKEMVRRRGRFPKTREEIENLPGVGQYIANSILMFCHDEPQPLLDVNMARVLERFFGPRKLADIRYDPYLQDLASRIIKGDNPALINWAILDFASLVCKKTSPTHETCPLNNHCRLINPDIYSGTVKRISRNNGDSTCKKQSQGAEDEVAGGVQEDGKGCPV